MNQIDRISYVYGLSGAGGVNAKRDLGYYRNQNHSMFDPSRPNSFSTAPRPNEPTSRESAWLKVPSGKIMDYEQGM